MVKGMLQGISPPRPLFVPIVFSLGARVENLPLRTFLGNPTKISNALRQIRSHLRSDGVACYFDPCLEAEALGGALEWGREDRRPRIRWPQSAEKGALPEGLRSPEEAAKDSRVTIAVEVIRRLRTLLQDEPLLMAGVTGPFTLAARITQLEDEDVLRYEDLSDAALEIAGLVIRQVSTAFVEAGADLILIQEEVLPTLSAKSCATWAFLLTPAFNIIRFYEALTVLHITNGRSFAENCDLIFKQHWDCIVCPALEGISSPLLGESAQFRAATLGIALPVKAFQPDASGEEELDKFLCHVISEWRPAILTTAGDMPPATDMKRLSRVLEKLENDKNPLG